MITSVTNSERNDVDANLFLLCNKPKRESTKLILIL